MFKFCLRCNITKRMFKRRSKRHQHFYFLLVEILCGFEKQVTVTVQVFKKQERVTNIVLTYQKEEFYNVSSSFINTILRTLATKSRSLSLSLYCGKVKQQVNLHTQFHIPIIKIERQHYYSARLRALALPFGGIFIRFFVILCWEKISRIR